MKMIPSSRSHSFAIAMLLAGGGFAQTQPAAVQNVQGVSQPAVQGVQKVAPPTVLPVTPPPPPEGVSPPPPAAKGVNPVDGVQAAARQTVQGVPPPPAAAVSSIRAVPGVQGILASRQRNLEAALRMKEAGQVTPAAAVQGGQGRAAAALLNGPGGRPAAPPTEAGDGRAALQALEKLDKPGS